jgi:uncharacterized protein YbbK (DUF523 family)
MNIAVSACLLGIACRYDGTARPCDTVIALGEQYQLIPLCPEVLGRLAIPHPAHEIITQHPLTVCDHTGTDNTEAFVRGAEKALAHARAHDCGIAILKSKSPSCGYGTIYDGTFSGTLVAGNGVTATRFIDAGIKVLDELSFAKYLNQEPPHKELDS